MTVPFDPLISATALIARLAAGAPITILDVRWQLGGPPGRPAYLTGHLPAAVFLDLDADLCAPPGIGGRHPMADPGQLQATFRRAGVRSSVPVVVYDADGGTASARTWWTLRWAGHPDVSVLDGGLAAWTGPVVPGDEQPEAGDFVVRPGQLPTLDAESAAGLARSGTLIDVRTPVRYRGEAEPIDPVAGHIPGAVNLPVTEHITAGVLDVSERLRETFENAGVRADRPVAAYCGSGVAAAQTVLALHRAGRTDAALYVGSWSDWITDPDRPIATGDQP